MLFTYATARSLASASVVTEGVFVNLTVIVYNGALARWLAENAVERHGLLYE